MRFILSGIGNWYSGWKLMEEAVPEAERLGFYGFVMPDHYMWGPGAGGDSTVDTWIALSFLASRTERIRLGTLVTPISFRPPGMLAKMVATLDVLSHGRTILGVGAGWSQTEFEGYGEWYEPRVRVERAKEGLSLILKLWLEDKVNFHGKYYQAKNAVLEPKPVQKPYPPLLFGGFSRRMLRMAGEYGDICFVCPWIEKVSYQEAKDIVLKAARRHSRQDKIRFAQGGDATVPIADHYDSKTYTTKVEEAQQNGNEYFVVPFPRETYLASMRDFAKNVMPSFNAPTLLA
ncbi:MAG TPA: LLM class flavin-dependent oxidoreductase [Candidatus Bathyarchaeia archaeon]|nr:LLM class flavin-dependent oxidoreductase [Candidatus Bathyarchaeia archaeon]